MGTITVRAPRAGDSTPLVELYVPSRRSYYEGHLPEAELAEWEAETRATDIDFTRPGRVWSIAELDGEVAGFAQVRSDELGLLHVHPDHWGKGVGHALHTACVENFRELGVAIAHLDVFVANKRARRFYLNHGWQEVSIGNEEPVHVRMSLRVG